jgi:hypothetical protein
MKLRRAQWLLVGLLAGAEARAEEPAVSRPLQSFGRVSVVFASENIRTPISAFGHTFLVFHDEPFPEPDAQAVDFSGDLSAPGAGVLAALFSSIPGRYRVRPFRDVAFEYDDEDRDLWVYAIRLDEDEKAALARTVIEQVGRAQRYNFVTRNCAQRVHALFLSSLRDFRCTPKVYAMPVDSIRALDRCGRIAGVSHQRSSLGRALGGLATLEPQDRARWLVAAHHDYFPAENQGGPLPAALGELLDYRLTRERDPELRTQLFGEKKRFPTDEASPARVEARPLRAPSAVTLEVAPLAPRATLSLRPIERSFLSASNDPLRSSTLELLSASITASRHGVRPSALVPFDFEALVPDTPLRSGLVRKLELAYRDWRSRLGYDAWEAGLQLGGGLAARASALDLAAVATAGVEESRLEGRRMFGVYPRLLTQVSLWPYRWLRLRGRYQGKLWQYSRIVHHVRGDLVVVDARSWSLGLGAEAMGRRSWVLALSSTLSVFF